MCNIHVCFSRRNQNSVAKPHQESDNLELFSFICYSHVTKWWSFSSNHPFWCQQYPLHSIDPLRCFTIQLNISLLKKKKKIIYYCVHIINSQEETQSSWMYFNLMDVKLESWGLSCDKGLVKLRPPSLGKAIFLPGSSDLNKTYFPNQIKESVFNHSNLNVALPHNDAYHSRCTCHKKYIQNCTPTSVTPRNTQVPNEGNKPDRSIKPHLSNIAFKCQ